MQANGKSEKDYVKTAKRIASWGVVDVLYFADSLGNMIPEDVQRICKSLKQGWPGTLGIHTHNNKNLALINSITAVENGVTWCDSTITGMGRGAGNASTESLILEMSRLGLAVRQEQQKLASGVGQDHLEIINTWLRAILCSRLI
jgi:4-hydroxy 2-oxovalerate aldolase